MSNRNDVENFDNGANVARTILGGLYGAYSAWNAGLEGSRSVGSQMSAFSSPSLVRSNIMTEKDSDVVSDVEVYLYTRPLEGQLVAARAQQHWSLVFRFPDTQRWITHEASQDDYGKLAAYCSNERPKEAKGGEVRFLGKCRISPKRLLEMANRNSHNDEDYNLFLHNCQNWIKEFAREIGGAIWKILKDEETLFESDPLTSLIGGIAQISSPAIFASTQASGQYQSQHSRSRRNDYSWDHN